MTTIDRAAEVISLALADDADVSIDGNYNDITTVSEATLDGKYDLTAVARALAAAGLLAPDLPEPMQHWEAERTGGTPGSRWYGYADDGNDDGSEMYNPHRYIDAHPGEVWIDGHVLLVPEDAKAYALALLAAADHAEEVGNDGQDD